MLKQRYELFVNCGSFVARFSSLFVLVFHSKCDKVCGYQCVIREIAGQIKTEKSFSQHHRNPLIISGFFVSDTFSDTVWDGTDTIRGCTQIAFLRPSGCIFRVTSLHQRTRLLEHRCIELLRVGNRVGKWEKLCTNRVRLFPTSRSQQLQMPFSRGATSYRTE